MAKKKKKPALQRIFYTNADYEFTRSHLEGKISCPRVLIIDTNTENPSGRYNITFPDEEHSPIIIYKDGKLQITYRSKRELQEIRDLLPNIVATHNDEPFIIDSERLLPNYLKHQLESIDSEIQFKIMQVEMLNYSPEEIGGDLYQQLLPIINPLKMEIVRLHQEREKLFPSK